MRHRDDKGSAMLITLLVMAVLTGLGAVVFNVGFSNLQNTNRDRLAGGALGASEGGTAQALAFIRQNGSASLTCTVPEVTNNCDALWGKDNPKIITLSNSRSYAVWVEKIQPFSPPDYKVGTYKIHSLGIAAKGLNAPSPTPSPGSGVRSIELTITVKPLTFPIGLYSDNFSDSGGASVHTESMFSRGCILNRDAITFTGNDRYHNIPASAHSTEYITETNNSCSDNDPGNIHSNAQKQCPSSPNYTVYVNDQDKRGGPFASDTDGAICLAGSAFTTSFFDLTELQKYGYSTGRPRGLSDGEYAALKSKAQEQGYFSTKSTKCGGSNTPPTCWNSPDPVQHPNGVMYFDLRAETGGLKTVEFQANDFGSPSNQNYGKAYCGQRSLIIVVEGGNLTINSSVDLVGALFVPDGTYKGNGNHNIIGTLFAKNVDKFTGTAGFSLDGPTGPPDQTNCFFDNFPGGLLDVTPTRFREVDR